MTNPTPRYFWTKVWGRPGEPATEALLFNSQGYRDGALRKLTPGDIVVYLTSDRTEADPMCRGRVAGAVQIEGDAVLATDLGIPGRARAVDFRADGAFRWPFGITLLRSWRVLDNESNDNLVPGHAEKKMQGAATIHEMTADQVGRFLSLRVEEQLPDGPAPAEVFSLSLRRPWRQKEGARRETQVLPGAELYVAVIHDTHGTTFKVGSGKARERLDALNLYRRPSQGEMLWSIGKGFLHPFQTPDAARDAEDHLIARAREAGHGSPDHGEFITGISMSRLRELYADAVEVGLARDAREFSSPE